MNFKEFFLLKEDPDNLDMDTYLRVPKVLNSNDFDARAFMIFDSFAIMAENNATHEFISMAFSNYINDANIHGKRIYKHRKNGVYKSIDYNDPEKQVEASITGEVPSYVQEYYTTLRNDKRIRDRSVILRELGNHHPLFGRVWVNSHMVSFWNDESDFNSANINTLKKVLEFYKLDYENCRYEVDNKFLYEWNELKGLVGKKHRSKKDPYAELKQQMEAETGIKPLADWKAKKHILSPEIKGKYAEVKVGGPKSPRYQPSYVNGQYTKMESFNHFFNAQLSKPV